MKRLFFNGVLAFTFVVLGVAAIGCQDQNQAGGLGSGPGKLEIVGGDTVDWGDVGGGKLDRKLKLVNAGGDSLRIFEVKPSCGCTATEIDKELLMPGDTATVGITMDVHGRKGEYVKYVNIMTSDSTTGGTRRVTLRANVIQEIEVDPGYFSIVNVKPGEKGSATITLRNVSDHAVTIQPPKAAGSTLIDVTFSMKQAITLQPGDSTQVTATAITLEKAPAGVDYLFTTDSKMTPEITARLNLITMADETIDASTGTGAPPVRMQGK
ncbi:MAG: DUF1573 domain-containing protein [Ignavibacteriae bacterium]|nr:DUF1573 domain-containing protein [Ignavibacteriota bacterium]MCB9215954.1 DUF1573 domain-containing protein [Ignavibacteria bacterium]